jgi:asparagine synthetase B (glutamine-hydrolysing)
VLSTDFAGAPYFAVRWQAGQTATRGQPTVRLGQQIARPDGAGDGIYAAWHWDGQRLLVRNDRYGAFPLFYAVRGTASDIQVALSPSIPKLLWEGAPTALDENALAVFLRLGFFLGEDTPFQAIRALPPGAALEWQAGQLRIQGGLFLAAPSRLSRGTAVEAYIELFRTAVQRRLPADDDFAVPLSGGRDSRHILLELCAQGRPPRFCATVQHHAPRTDQDAAVAKALAARLGIAHVVLPQRESRFRAELRKNLRTGFCTDEATHFLALGDYLDGRVSAVFDGMGGDVLSAGLFLNEHRLRLFEAARFESLAELLLDSELRVESLLVFDQLRRFSRARAIERLTVELIRHAEAPNPVGSFYFWNRTRREIVLAPTFLYDASLIKLYPYLDHDLYDLLAALPARLLLDYRLHTDTILQAYPEYDDLPFEDYQRLFRYDQAHRAELSNLVWDTIRYLSKEPSRLLYAPYVETRLLHCYIAGREPRHFTDHAIYLLQLERFVNGLVNGPQASS